MSASREKNLRKQQRGEGTEKRQIRAVNEVQKKKTRKKIATAAAVVVVILLVFLVLVNSTLLYTGVPAVKAGDWKFTKADLDYEKYLVYQTTYQNLYNTYGEYISYVIDTSRPLSEQQYSDTQTWDDYFRESAVDNLVQVAALWDKGHAEGYPESDDFKLAADSAVDSLRTASSEAGYRSFNTFLNINIGKGVTEKTIRNMIEKVHYASAYSQKLVDDWKAAFTEEELDEYYEGVRDSYDTVTYAGYYSAAATDADEEGSDPEEAKKEAKAKAELIAESSDEDSFHQAVLDNCGEDELFAYQDKSSILSNSTPRGLSEEWREWFTDESRQYGDTVVMESDNGYYALMFIGLEDNDYQLADYHVISIYAEPDEETGEISDEALTAAEETANDVAAQFAEDPTEEHFEELAAIYSGDAASVSAGGAYQNMSKNAFQSGLVNEYVFAPGRAEGDSSVIKDGSTYYFVLFDGYGDNYRQTIASELLTQDKYDELIAQLSEQYPVKTTIAYKLTK
ncbi:MAG: peptidylprolyl isomerase [Oscillospiraceae bacterium]|nr:peptidylprolyl isomerase [Oscillospiraceae bacterium]